MEQRDFPRIQIPLLVELKHPSLGKRSCIARDISESGIFVTIENAPVKLGSKLKLTLQNPLPTDTQHMPTVDVVVKRVEPEGVGLAFSNATSRHLWQSVARLRDELAVGRDYFQVYVAALVKDPGKRLLLVQEHGRWTFPGKYLLVGEDWRKVVQATLATLKLQSIEIGNIIELQSHVADELPEAALIRIWVTAQATADEFSLAGNEAYRDAMWLERRRDLDEITLADDEVRTVAASMLDNAADGESAA